MSSIYLDHAATTPMFESALIAMTNQASVLGNPSSLHTHGRATRKKLEDARELLAKEIACLPSEIIFTASGTEANNIALKGMYWAGRKRGKNLVVISSIEHHAILDPAQWLATHEGAEVIQIPVNSDGVIDLAFLTDLIAKRGPEIAVISVMHSNNETGVIQPIAAIVAASGDIAVHIDAVQSFKKVPLSFDALGVSALSLSAHKIGGPLGIGALILKRGIEIPSLLHGGGQEREIRSGTLNAPGIVGFATAAVSDDYNAQSVAAIRDRFITSIQALIPEAVINGLTSERLPGIVNVTFPGTQSDTLLLLMDAQKISCSTGSACSAGVHEASHVLLAMGHSEITAQSSLRFSFGATSTQSECDFVTSVLPDVIARARAANIS
ncbi:MAG: cysteine desulfurase family protein [Actinomycetota bacterium]|nr:cysteine desulfurase family protein [Actinomycetota bacterium]